MNLIVQEIILMIRIVYELDNTIEHYAKNKDRDSKKIVEFYLKERKELVKKIRINVFNKLNKVGV